MEFPVPELGEGIDQATVVRVLVTPGSQVAEGQDIVELETEKSTMPVGAPAAGTVEKIHVKPGDKVKVGASLISASADGKPLAASQTKEPAKPQTTTTPPAKPQAAVPAKPQAAATSDGRRIEFKLPDLGEGITGGTVVNVLAKAGDSVEAEQPLLELETEKASIPIPSPAKGRVAEMRVKQGQTVRVGEVLVVLSSASAEPLAASHGKRAPTADQAPAAPSSPAKPRAAAVPEAPSINGRSERNGDHRLVPAGPATRRLARELGVDLQQVPGSAPGGRVTQDDVKSFVRGMPKGPAAPTATSGMIAAPPLPDFSKYGPVEKKPFTGLRKAIAKNLTVSWNVAPQVTQHDVADITELEASRKQFVEGLPKGAPKVTMTVLAVKACVAALKAIPNVNASYDPSAGEYGELIVKKYYHIGIAVDTERGLVVPVIRDADKKGIAELAKELAELAEKARAGKLMPDEMRGGTFTITNLGGIGGTAFSPVLNYPEVAILGISRSSWQPAVRGDKIEPRLMLPLSFTYDHRVIDGADGARFCARLASFFSDPLRMFFES
jgi:pyruvate dehydrogenase E2 component (dihydrolipoamide acetyltransferase)